MELQPADQQYSGNTDVSTAHRSSTLKRLLILLLPLACNWDGVMASGPLNFEGPVGPTRTATADLRVAANADRASAFLGRTFMIPNAGATIAPAFSGQTIGVQFLGGRTPIARVSVAGAAFETAATFAPCEFRVIEVPIPNPTEIRVGHTFRASPCDFVVNSAGLETSRSGESRAVQLIFGTATSEAVMVQVRTEGDGTVMVYGLIAWTPFGTVPMSDRE
jgi:hypothetical protein